ncbi:hypothetical protein JCM10831_03100 [Hydrogenophilus hirschii]
MQQRGLSIRAACQAFRISQACYRYEARRDTEDEEIANRILAIDYDNFKNSVEDHDLHAAYARLGDHVRVAARFISSISSCSHLRGAAKYRNGVGEFGA